MRENNREVKLHKIVLGILLIISVMMIYISNIYALTDNELKQIEKLLNFSDPNYVYNKTYVDDFISRHAISTQEAMERAARIMDIWENSNHTCDNETSAMNPTRSC